METEHRTGRDEAAGDGREAAMSAAAASGHP
jgi:hypothetical protein